MPRHSPCALYSLNFLLFVYCLSYRLIIVWNLFNSSMKIPLFCFSTFRWNRSFPTLQKNLYFFHLHDLDLISHHFYMLTICSFYSSFALFSFQWSQSFRFLVGSSGLEPPTSRLSGARSNHLSYEPIQYPRCIFSPSFASGGDDGIRTHDPLLAGQVLSQLSYTPMVVGFSVFFLSDTENWTTSWSQLYSASQYAFLSSSFFFVFAYLQIRVIRDK